jgi:hypothetical protein
VVLKRGRHVTLTGIITGITAIGGICAYCVDWAIKTQDRLGESAAQRDSLTVAVQILDKRVATLEHKLKVRGGRTVLLNHEPPQGLARRIFHLFW